MPGRTFRSRLFLASMVGRLPVGAIGLLLVLRTREATGSFAAGGAVAGVNALATGVAAPMVGRVMDRRGQSGVIVATALVFAAAMAGFAALPETAPLGWALALAALAGAALPPLGPALRAIWTRELTDPGERHLVFTVESTLFELIYILGPLLFLTAIGAWSLAVATLSTGIVTLAAALAFASAPAARRWRPDDQAHRHLLGALRDRRFCLLVAVFVLFGVNVAAIEIGVVAFLEEHDARGAIGPVLAVWGLGSMAGGAVAARRAAPADPGRRIAALFAGVGLGSVPLVLATSPVSLGALIALSGVFIAPALSVAFAAVGQVAPPGTVTEAYTWSATGIALGAAAGSALAGWLVEVASPDQAFLLGAGAAVLASLPPLLAAPRTRGD